MNKNVLDSLKLYVLTTTADKFSWPIRSECASVFTEKSEEGLHQFPLRFSFLTLSYIDVYYYFIAHFFGEKERIEKIQAEVEKL